MSKILLIGVDHTGLSPEKLALLNSCRAVFATRRFTPLLEGYQGAVYPITPQAEALATIRQLLDADNDANLAMLASGDPLFFGIGQTLINTFGKDRLEIHPALSSMQLAFARIKKSWQDAHVISLHGRSNFSKSVLQHKTIFLFTDKINTPAAIARQFQGFITETAGVFQEQNFEVYVLENLGLPDEKLTHGSLAQIADHSFADLNVMIIDACTPPSNKRDCRFGLTEQDIEHSRGLITKDEVRAVVLHKLALPEEGVFWDVGAGSGSISVEAAGICPLLEIYSVERDSAQQQNIAANCRNYCLANIHLVKGQAPEVLAQLPRPDRIFIGGSGGNLPGIITHAAPLLADSGRIVITAVTDATRRTAPELLQANGFSVEISEVRVTRSVYPTDSQSPVQLNPITIITGRSHDR